MSVGCISESCTLMTDSRLWTYAFSSCKYLSSVRAWFTSILKPSSRRICISEFSTNFINALANFHIGQTFIACKIWSLVNLVTGITVFLRFRMYILHKLVFSYLQWTQSTSLYLCLILLALYRIYFYFLCSFCQMLYITYND